MSESEGGSPIQVGLFVLLLAGGGWYFFRNYTIEGLDRVSVYPRDGLTDDQTYISYRDDPPALSESTRVPPTSEVALRVSDNPFRASADDAVAAPVSKPIDPLDFDNVRIASWALDGFGPTKLGNPTCRQYIARVIRQFDVVALQQLASIERDLVPRLVELINEGGGRYDYVVGRSTGPHDRMEQLAFVFDTTRVRVDRRQTYTVEDPDQQMTFDPLVAWFRAAQPSVKDAWTFSLVNVRIDLARAPQEVALLKEMVAAIRNDGRGEDDVLLAGLFQADDAYLRPSIDANKTLATVSNRPTDIFGRYQTSNVLFNSEATQEFLGRGGVFDYLRRYELNVAEAETVTSHLPVYGEFTATEGGFGP